MFSSRARYWTRHLAPLLVGGVLSGCHRSGESAPTERSTAAVSNANADVGDPAVVAILPRSLVCGEPPPAVRCTGTLIDERAVLSAAHCVDGFDDQPMFVTFGTDPNAVGAERRHVVKATVHPKYSRDSSVYDVAILWLDSATTVTPIQILSDEATFAWEGASARVVGFGEALDASIRPGSKREGAVLATLDGAEVGTVRYEPDPAMTCNGDSGGPIFVNQGGSEFLAGVTVAGDESCKTYGVASRVSEWWGDFVAPALAGGAPADPASPVTLDNICLQPLSRKCRLPFWTLVSTRPRRRKRMCGSWAPPRKSRGRVHDGGRV